MMWDEVVIDLQELYPIVWDLTGFLIHSSKVVGVLHFPSGLLSKDPCS
jgi:hypothetical protein